MLHKVIWPHSFELLQERMQKIDGVWDLNLPERKSFKIPGAHLTYFNNSQTIWLSGQNVEKLLKTLLVTDFDRGNINGSDNT